MGLATFDIALAWVQSHGYALIFLAMVIEGPMLTTAAAFAAALGKLDLPIIMALSFAGDFVGDIIHYAIGYWGRERVLDRYGHKVGISGDRLKRFEIYLDNHAGKSLLLAKCFPALSSIVLLASGAIRMPLKRFLTLVTVIIIPRTILFVSLGFYAGRAFTEMNRVVENTLSLIMLFAAGFLGLFLLYKAAARKIASRIGNEEGNIIP